MHAPSSGREGAREEESQPMPLFRFVLEMNSTESQEREIEEAWLDEVSKQASSGEYVPLI